ncbi:hypothetical protein TWF730_009186 [Orbilia blumenaviensis]|uniref:Uncharacterized protein n=1 Tax=Orbilia blumenaviensis TaxID=1796055 RepID=A0AAV9UXL1_9PEZI
MPITDLSSPDLRETPKIYARTFTRSLDPDVQDVDTPVTEEFMQKNFTDRFGQLLYQPSPEGIYAGNILDQDTLLKYILSISTSAGVLKPTPDYAVQAFAVADAATIKYDATKLGDWYNPHLRFLYAVRATADGPGNYYESVTFLVVGSPNVTDPAGFLQAASWDPTISEFRFYEKIYDEETQTGFWTYNGKSSDAFNKDTEYLGPFNGHVNGAVIMKELQQPWLHWQSTDGTILDCLSKATINSYLQYPYLSDENTGSPFSKLGNGNDLQKNIIQPGVMNWFNQRFKNDFKDSSGKFLDEPLNVKRWAAHAIMTTTINIITAVEDPAGGRKLPPMSMFVNQDAIGFVKLWPTGPAIISYTDDLYKTASDGLDLVLMQELFGDTYPEGSIQLKNPGTLGGGRQTDSLDIVNFMVAKQGEGKDFTVLTPSYEDNLAIKSLYGQTVKPNTPALFTPTMLQALVSFDFPNPVYSWKRSILINYIPETTKRLPGNTYDLDTQFIDNLRNSSYASQPDSPEAQFLEYYQTFQPSSVTLKIKNYIGAISRNFKSPAYIKQYLQLAESKRRIYRPLPLDEFGYTLPYARGIEQTAPWLEMTDTGEVQNMDQRGVDFFTTWRNSVSSFDPHLLPQSSSSADTNAAAEGVQNLTVSAKCPSRKRSGGCPYTRRNLVRRG